MPAKPEMYCSCACTQSLILQTPDNPAAVHAWAFTPTHNNVPYIVQILYMHHIVQILYMQQVSVQVAPIWSLAPIHSPGSGLVLVTCDGSTLPVNPTNTRHTCCCAVLDAAQLHTYFQNMHCSCTCSKYWTQPTPGKTPQLHTHAWGSTTTHVVFPAMYIRAGAGAAMGMLHIQSAGAAMGMRHKSMQHTCQKCSIVHITVQGRRVVGCRGNAALPQHWQYCAKPACQSCVNCLLEVQPHFCAELFCVYAHAARVAEKIERVLKTHAPASTHA